MQTVPLFPLQLLHSLMAWNQSTFTPASRWRRPWRVRAVNRRRSVTLVERSTLVHRCVSSWFIPGAHIVTQYSLHCIDAVNTKIPVNQYNWTSIELIGQANGRCSYCFTAQRTPKSTSRSYEPSTKRCDYTAHTRIPGPRSTGTAERQIVRLEIDYMRWPVRVRIAHDGVCSYWSWLSRA